jgi:hypothetical protein
MSKMYSEMKRPLPEDIKKVLSDPLNERVRVHFSDEFISKVCDDPYSAVALVDGKPVMVGGLVFYWDGRGRIWSMFTSVGKHEFISVFRLMKKYIENLTVKRIEMDVPCHEEKFKKRAELLGFTKYAERARCYNAFGEDCTLFERIN